MVLCILLAVLFMLLFFGKCPFSPTRGSLRAPECSDSGLGVWQCGSLLRMCRPAGTRPCCLAGLCDQIVQSKASIFRVAEWHFPFYFLTLKCLSP